MLGPGEIIYFILLLIALIISILRKKVLPWHFVFFRYLLFFSFLFDLAGFTLKFFNYPRYWVYHLYRPLDYVLLATLFFYEIDGQVEKKFIKYSCYLFIAGCIVFSIVNNFNGPTSITSTFGNAIIIIICVLYFKSVLGSEREIVLIKEPIFWITTGTFLFCIGTFFSMGFLNYLQKNNNPLASKYFLINYVMNYALYLTYIIGLLCSKTYQKSSL